MTKVSLEFVHVVGTLAATTGMLAVDGVYAQASRPDAEDERVLRHKSEIVSRRCDMDSTLDRTEPSYSVFRCTVKFRTDFLCSCCNRPKMVKGKFGLWATSCGTSFRYTVTRLPGYAQLLVMHVELLNVNVPEQRRCPPPLAVEQRARSA